MSTDSRLDPRTRLADGNAMFLKSVPPTVLANLVKGQHPFVAVLTCSDSRVSPVSVFNLSLGEAFVVRVAGNCAADPTVLGSLEYAVSHLKVRAIMVLGHTHCGAVRESCSCVDHGNLEPVIRDIERARARLSAEAARDEDMVAESNVMIQMRRLLDLSPVIRAEVESGKVDMIGAMFDLATGKVRFVNS